MVVNLQYIAIEVFYGLFVITIFFHSTTNMSYNLDDPRDLERVLTIMQEPLSDDNISDIADSVADPDFIIPSDHNMDSEDDDGGEIFAEEANQHAMIQSDDNDKNKKYYWGRDKITKWQKMQPSLNVRTR